MMTTEQPAEFMTRQQAAEYLGVSLMTIDKWIRDGRLRRGAAVIENRTRSVVNGADVQRLKVEREGVRWEGEQPGEE